MEDVFKDVVRINERYRDGLDAGYIYKISHEERRCYAIIRGTKDAEIPAIEIDERLRDTLGIELGEQADLQLKRANWVEEQIWSFGASDPAYRASARLALISLFLGIVGLILGVISLKK